MTKNNFTYNVRVGMILVVFALFCMGLLAGFCFLIVESIKAGV